MSIRGACRWLLLLIVVSASLGSISFSSLSETYESITLGSNSETYYKDCDGDGYVPMDSTTPDEYEQCTEDCELQERYVLTEICYPGIPTYKQEAQTVCFFGSCYTYYILVEIPTEENCYTHSDLLGIEWVCESTCDAKEKPECYTRTEEPLGEDMLDNDPSIAYFPSPAGVTATSNSNPDRAVVEWASVDGATGYEIWRSTSSETNGSVVCTTSDTSYPDTNVAVGTTYYYRIRAYRESGGGTGYSDYCYYNNYYYSEVPIPADVAATDGTEWCITVTWQEVIGADSYQVYRSPNSAEEFLLCGESTDLLAFVDETVVNGTSYYYQVVAVQGTQSSSPSAPVVGKASFPIPTVDNCILDTAWSIALTWGTVEGADAYQVYYQERRSSSQWQLLISLIPDITDEQAEELWWVGTLAPLGDPTASPSYTHRTIQPGVIYRYKVAAIRGDRSSDLSEFAFGFVSKFPEICRCCTPPVNVQASDGTHDAHVTITWNTVSIASVYWVFRKNTEDTSQSGYGDVIAHLPYTSDAQHVYYDTTAEVGESYDYRVMTCVGVSCSSDTLLCTSSPDCGYRKDLSDAQKVRPSGRSAEAVYIDNVPPSVSLSTAANESGVSPIVFFASFSEPVSDLSASGVDATNGSVVSVARSGESSFDISVQPHAQGDVVAWILSGAVQDMSGNWNERSHAEQVEYDLMPELTEVSISTDNASGEFCEVGDTVTLTFTASEALRGLPEVEVGGCDADVTYQGGNEYIAVCVVDSSTREGEIEFEILFEDRRGNEGAVGETTDGSYVIFDSEPPVIEDCPDDITEQCQQCPECPPGSQQPGVEVSWDEPMAEDYLSGIASFTQTAGPPSGSCFSAPSTTPIEYTAIDEAGNVSTCSFDVTVEGTAPTVVVELEGHETDPTSDAEIDFLATFSEYTIQGFETGDVDLDGTAGATTAMVSQAGENGDVWRITVSGMTQSGTVAVTVPAGAATSFWTGLGNQESNECEVDYVHP